MKLLIFAMIEEAQDTINSLEFSKVDDLFLNYYQNKESYLLITGIGLVNASLTLSVFLTKHKEIKEIINIGTAGSCSQELNVKDVVIIDKTYYSAADLTGFNYSYGQLPGEPKYYHNPHINAEFFKNLKIFEPKISSLASSDIFINSEEKFNNFVKKTDVGVEVFDMEGAALSHVANRFKKQIVIIKIISDNLLNNSSEIQFDQFLQEISIKISKILKLVLK
ncbi:5'-methylthioadenosine/S-adenosylhomocysteine nucleosidase [Spiroplasma alleghenense]|uniref:adenosylhomocysteine nucleosidase n=1 Tax=Spiroplasma alleghenense TaxID=216931 RepID=A0A345Z3R3_9MOLU|nr:5'-methylthioadenosine/S-adenosylhomocysteine nucleosidase [Spiroplasma alleghenense]AXK51242.1 adenosylhomocysteine nucleosidase [Spiroplasma alleghenense]